jgi:predicted RNase H-like nuclease
LDFKKIHAGTMPASEFDTGDAQAQKIINFARRLAAEGAE